MPVTQTAVVTTQARHPQVAEIADVPTQQSIRLLWDVLQSTRDELTAAQATITSLVAAVNANEAAAASAQRAADQALAITQNP